MTNQVPHSQDLVIGKQLANFRIERLLKRGGMSQIYKGWDVMLQRPVAVKVIDARYRTSSAYAERFLREARSVAGWWHENIMRIYYADKDEGLYYFVMEFIDGMDMRELLNSYQNELMPQEDVLRIGYGVARALDYAHDQGVIHRDVKPSNVMVSVDGRVLLTDFGLAMTIEEGSQGEIFGTPRYIAPEQARQSADAVPQSDQYSLAVILYEMLTGQTPFYDESPISLALKHVQEKPPSPRLLNPQLNEQVEAVLLQGLNKRGELRFGTAVALMNALSDALGLEASATNSSPLLPMMPAVVEQTDGADMVPFPTLSQISVAEKLALELDVAEPTIELEPVRRPVLRRWLLNVVLILLLCGVGSGGLWWLNGRFPLANNATATPVAVVANKTPTATATQTPTATATSTELPVIVPSVTERPSETPTTTNTPTQTVLPTVTETPFPTNTPTITHTPTPAFTGPRVRLIFDDDSFYLLNLSSQDIPVSGFVFESINNNGDAVSYRFLGRGWSQIFADVQSGRCVSIEPYGTGAPLSPNVCDGYNARLTPGPNDLRLFWRLRSDEGIDSFRVFWNGVPVKTCRIVLGACELRLPEL